MTCPNIPTKILIHISPENKLQSFSFERSNTQKENLLVSDYCLDKDIQEIIDWDFFQVAKDLNVEGEEALFFLHVEIEALRSALAKYLGSTDETIDTERCIIEGIEHTEKGSQMSILILPPQNFPDLKTK